MTTTTTTRTPSTDDRLRDVVRRLERLERIEMGEAPASERCAIFRAALTVAQERIRELTGDLDVAWAEIDRLRAIAGVEPGAMTSTPGTVTTTGAES